MTFDEVERIQMYVMRRSRNEMRNVFTGEGWGGGGSEGNFCFLGLFAYFQ